MVTQTGATRVQRLIRGRRICMFESFRI